MDFQQMLMELLMGQPQGGKITDRMWPGGPTMGMGPGGAPLMPNSSPIMSRGGPVPGASMMPKSSPSLGPIDMMSGPGQSVAKTPPMGMNNLPPGFALSGAQPPGALPPSGLGNPGMMGFQPPNPMMGLGQPAQPQPAPPVTPTGPTMMAGAGGPTGFRSAASRLFGGGGEKSLYNILADAMAGVAAADPRAPGIKAFGQGFTGARASKKVRDTDAEKKLSDAEETQYEREGTDLDREYKRFQMDNTGKNSRLQRIKALVDISKSLSGDPDSFRRRLQESAFRGGIPIDEKTLNEQTQMAFPDWKGGQAGDGGWSPDSGTPPPKGYKRYNESGRWIQWDGKQWLDEQGNPVPTS